MTSAPPTSPRAPRARRRVGMRLRATAVAVAAALGVSAVLTGCDLRVETPDPTPLVPDAAEQLRDRSAIQAADLAGAARAAATTAPEAAVPVLAEIAVTSQQHVDALGGVYDPFPGVTPAPTPTATATADPPPPADAAGVLAALRSGADTARADAVAEEDAAMAHLLAGIALNRALLADRLAVALGEDPAELPTVVVPTALPAGLDAQAAAVLVQSEDAAGLAWEVVAGRATDEARTRAAERAALHRERAEAWAEAAGFAGTGTDPRRAAYDLPEAITGDGLAPEVTSSALSGIDSGLGEAYAALVPVVGPQDRPALLDAALEAMLRATRLGADVPVLPGMPTSA